MKEEREYGEEGKNGSGGEANGRGSRRQVDDSEFQGSRKRSEEVVCMGGGG